MNSLHSPLFGVGLLWLLGSLVWCQESHAKLKSPHPKAPAPMAQVQARDVFSSREKLIFQVKIALNKVSPKASYGSGFFVRGAKEGEKWVATNFHVVADTVDDPSLKIFVSSPQHKGTEKQFEAELIDIDVIHDLALLKVNDPTFTEGSEVIELRAEPPKNGEKVFSVGLPKDLNMLIVEGNFNDGKRGSVFERYVLSTPLNGGMSGGPTLDQEGHLVGVNVAYLRESNNISFAVPAGKLAALLDRNRRLEGEGRKVASQKDFMARIQDQLLDLQDKQSKVLVSGKPARSDFGPWSVEFVNEGLNCWRTETKNETEGAVTDDQRCFLPFDATLFRGWQSGDYAFRTFRVRSKEAGRKLAMVELNTLIQSGDLGYLTQGGSSREKSFSGRDCRSVPVKNENGIEMLLAFCMVGYREFPSLYNYFVEAISWAGAKDDRFVVQGLFRGVTQESIKKITQEMISKIKWNEAKREVASP